MQKYPYDTFISYATEDESYAEEMSCALKYLGFSVWFAPLSLEIGDRLLDSINAGLNSSMYGVILLSPHYVSKQWTDYEMDVLHRQHIEKNKKLLPLWHGITKDQIDNWNPGLTGIVALNSSMGVSQIAERIAKVISNNSPIRGVAPSYEDPQWRFLQGRAELLVNSAGGPAFNIFEAAEFPDSDFPLHIHGMCYSKQDIVIALTKVMFYKSHDKMRVDKQQWKRLIKLCKEYGYDLKNPNFDAATI